MSISLGVVVFLIVIALAFDFMNGFHDAANSIATVVSTRVLKPHWAVLWAAFFNFVALFIFELRVATTVGTGIVDTAIVDHYVVFAADRRGHLERHHVVLRNSLELVSCARRGHRRGSGLQRRNARADRKRAGDARGLHRAVAAARVRPRLDAAVRRVVDLRAGD